VAREAIRRADEERDRCHKLQREVEQRKRLLLDKENALNLKEDELAQATGAYRMATSRTHLAEHKAREADQLLQAKLKIIGKRAHDLGEKEAQLAQERMLLAQDRIALVNLKKQILRSRCALCKMGAESAEIAVRRGNNNLQTTTDHQLPQMTTSSADLLLKMSAQEPGQAQSDIVERMLDENIEASYRRMYNAPPSSSLDDADYGLTGGLDDDSKVAMDHGRNLDLDEAFLANFK